MPVCRVLKYLYDSSRIADTVGIISLVKPRGTSQYNPILSSYLRPPVYSLIQYKERRSSYSYYKIVSSPRCLPSLPKKILPPILSTEELFEESRHCTHAVCTLLRPNSILMYPSPFPSFFPCHLSAHGIRHKRSGEEKTKNKTP